MDQYGEEGRRMDRERGSMERARASEKMRLSEERVRLSEERMRLSEERSMRSEDRNSRSEEKSRRRHRESHSSRSSRGDDDRLPRAYQVFPIFLRIHNYHYHLPIFHCRVTFSGQQEL